MSIVEYAFDGVRLLMPQLSWHAIFQTPRHFVLQYIYVILKDCPQKSTQAIL
jgi:hypothetical protein